MTLKIPVFKIDTAKPIGGSLFVINKRALLVVSVLAIVCAACSSEQAGLRELKKLCEKDAGLAIYKTVEADGYYDSTRKGGALRLLIDSDYRFTEFCNFEPNITSLFDAPGCWRLTKVLRATGHCDLRVDKALNRSGGYSYPEFRIENCIAVKKLDEPEARYSYHSELKSWPARNGVSIYTKNTEMIMNVGRSEMYGSYTTYLFDKKPPYSIPTACSDFIEGFPSYVEAKLVDSVIKPIQGEME